MMELAFAPAWERGSQPRCRLRRLSALHGNHIEWVGKSPAHQLTTARRFALESLLQVHDLRSHKPVLAIKADPQPPSKPYQGDQMRPITPLDGTPIHRTFFAKIRPSSG